LVVFKVTVPSKLFVNSETFPPDKTTELVTNVPGPDISFANILTVLGLNEEENDTELLFAIGA
jgi:hypothetical protein